MIKKGTTGIYTIINMMDGKKYIGQALDIKERNKGELSSLRGGYFHNQHLQRVWNKYGEKNFIFIFLEECTEEKLDERERYHIKLAGWPDHGLCYNINEGGESGGRRHPETCKKISDANTGDKHFTKKMAPEEYNEYSKKQSDSHIGKKRSKESRNKQSESIKGENNFVAKMTPEEYDIHCKKLSDARKGIVFTQKHKDNLSKAQNGKELTKEHRNNISKSLKGKNKGENNGMYGADPWNKNKECPKTTGENNGNASITRAGAICIKTLLKYTDSTISEIAAMVEGATYSIVYSIKSGRTWGKVGIEADSL